MRPSAPRPSTPKIGTSNHFIEKGTSSSIHIRQAIYHLLRTFSNDMLLNSSRNVNLPHLGKSHMTVVAQLIR